MVSMSQWAAVAVRVWVAQVEDNTPTVAEGPLSGVSGLLGLVPYFLIFGVLYWLLVRPASKQRQQHEQMLGGLKKDDEIVTTSGIYGRLFALEEKIVTLEIADKVRIKILRDKIAGRWDPTLSQTTAVKTITSSKAD